MNFASWKKDKIVYSLIIAYIVIFIFLLLYKYFSFQLDWSYDLGVQNQILWKLANEGSFRSTIYLSYPPRWIILFFILPAYLLYQSPVTLLILKAILFGAAAVPLYRLSKLLKLAPPYQYLVVFSYLFNIGVIRTLLNDFFPDSLALPLLIFSFYFMYTRRTMHFLLFSFLALSCRAEIYGIYIAIFATWFIIKDRSNIRFAMLAFIILVMFSLLNPYILQDASHKRLYFTNTIKEILLPGSLDMSLAEIIYLLEPILPLGLLLLLAPEGIVSLVIYLAGTAILLIHINQGTLIVLHTNITHAVSSISAPFLIFGVFCIKQLESLRLPKRAIKIALFAVFAFALFFGSRYFIMQHNNLSYGQIIESWGALGHVPENASLALDYFMIAQGSSRSNALCYNELPREDSLENIDFILLNSAHPYLNNLSLEGSNVILERFRPVTAGHYILLERKETIS